MGSYLSKPVVEKISEDTQNDGVGLSFGASSMQGWRVSQEDAYNAILDFDESVSLFGVYDGHGGHEVATYTANHLPDFIKRNGMYTKKEFSKSLTSSFLDFDQTLVGDKILSILKNMAEGKEEDELPSDVEAEKEEVSHLCKEATMPLAEVMAKYSTKNQKHVSPKLQSKRVSACGSSTSGLPSLEFESSSEEIDSEVDATASQPALESETQKQSKVGDEKRKESEIEKCSRNEELYSVKVDKPICDLNKCDDKPNKELVDESSVKLGNDNCIQFDNKLEKLENIKNLKSVGENEGVEITKLCNGDVIEGIKDDAKLNGLSVHSKINGDIKDEGGGANEDGICLNGIKDTVSTAHSEVNKNSSSTDICKSEVTSESDSSYIPKVEHTISSSDTPDEKTSTSSSGDSTGSKGTSNSLNVDIASANKLSKGVGKGKGTSKGKNVASKAVPEVKEPKQRRVAATAAEMFYKAMQDGDEVSSDEESEEEDDSFCEDEDEGLLEEEIDSDDVEEESEFDEEDSDEDDDEGCMHPNYQEMKLNMREEPGFDSGCTACLALLYGTELFVANVGDSRCVVCRDGKAVDMSVDHKPEDEIETNRILKAGGRVTCDGRVNGGLNLSRALGDHSYKQNKSLSPEEQMISPKPDMQQLELTPKDKFIVIACDGIWNSLTSQEVCDFVGKEIDKCTKLSEICEKLFDHCLAPDVDGDGTGCDNMTCVIIRIDDLNKLHGVGSKTSKRPSEVIVDETEPKLSSLETQPQEKKRKIDE